MFVQMRTPFRDSSTGRLVLDVDVISISYLKGWFALDLLSILPFEFIQYAAGDSRLASFQLLRFFRLTRLFKLLRVFRASRKLQQAKVSANMSHIGLELTKV
jgi:hypothetical protein